MVDYTIKFFKAYQNENKYFNLIFNYAHEGN